MTLIARPWFNQNPSRVVASLDKALYGSYLCLAASSKQQIYVGRSQLESSIAVRSKAGVDDSSKIKAPSSLPRKLRINMDQSNQDQFIVFDLAAG